MATFMDLPPELRLQIYQNLKGTRPLPMERNIQYVVSRYTDSTAILQTNRTIYNEASFILDHKAEGIRVSIRRSLVCLISKVPCEEDTVSKNRRFISINHCLCFFLKNEWC